MFAHVEKNPGMFAHVEKKPGMSAYVEKTSKNRAWMGFYPTQNNQKLASEGKKYHVTFLYEILVQVLNTQILFPFNRRPLIIFDMNHHRITSSCGKPT